MVCTNPSLLQLCTVSLKNFWTPVKGERKFPVIQLMFCTGFSVGSLKAVWGSQAAQRKPFTFPRPHQWTKAHNHSFSSAAKPIQTFEVEESAQCQDIWLCTRRWKVHPAQCPGTEGHMCIIDNGEVRTWTSTGKTRSREGVNWKQKLALDASGCLTSGCVPSDSRMKENHPPALCKERSKSTKSVKKKLRSKKGEAGKSELALQVQVTLYLSGKS